MTLDTKLEIAAIVIQAVVVGLLVFRRIFSKLPLFSSYLVWLLLVQGANFFAARNPASYQRVYFLASLIDSVFMLCVLVELSMSVLSPLKGQLPRWTFLLVGALILIAFAAIWPFAKPSGFDALSHTSQLFVRLDVTTSVLRIVSFLALATLSQLLSIGWRDRELQIATGLGLYSLISLSVTLLQMNLGTSSPDALRKYHALNEVATVGYVVSMLYWTISFVQRVPERREFTPQMQNLLLALAGNVRSTRITMTGSAFKKDRDS